MEIRRAETGDMRGIADLLCQVLAIHHQGRPDLFKGNARKYTDEELKALIQDDTRPVFVAADDDNKVLGYAFCKLLQQLDDNIMTDINTLNIDDLCVDEDSRGRHIGRTLYEYVLNFARGRGCYNVTLNVWECNTAAKLFYEKCGLVPQKIGMEKIL